jgi:excisionase family DNA binding protein
MSSQVESGYVGGRPLLSRDQVAECLGASVSTVVRLERRGDLPHVKLGRLVRFRPVDVDALIERAYGGNSTNDESPACIALEAETVNVAVDADGVPTDRAVNTWATVLELVHEGIHAAGSSISKSGARGSMNSCRCCGSRLD